MTSRERVKRCLEFDHPDRVPRDCWITPSAPARHGEAAIKAFGERWPMDFTQPNVGRQPAKRLKGNPTAIGLYVDEWGCEFENIQEGVIGEVKHPMVSDWSKLDRVQPPTELLDVDRRAVNDFCRNADRYIIAGGWARPFERIQFLRGTENVYYDLAEESSEFLELVRRVHAFDCAQYEVWAKTDCDALAMMDDWGSQRALLISPDQWRRLFKPLYAEYVRIAHDNGKHFWMHSDGYIMDIYEDLIEIGVDAVNSQLFCMDIEEIGRRFAGRIAFWGEIDRQHILPYGSTQDVRTAVERVVKNLWRPEGGCIAQFEFFGVVPMANADAVYQSWLALTQG
jgi:uroporphyrinogen decarboxylase